MTGTLSAEAANYETAVVALGDVAAAVARLADAVSLAQQSARNTFDQVEEVEEARRAVAAAAAVVAEQMQARGVDAGSMAGLAGGLELLDADHINKANEHLESVLSFLDAGQSAVTDAATSVQDSEATLMATYGDAAETVARTGVDGEFLDSGARSSGGQPAAGSGGGSGWDSSDSGGPEAGSGASDDGGGGGSRVIGHRKTTVTIGVK